jgi:hypothetical protein
LSKDIYNINYYAVSKNLFYSYYEYIYLSWFVPFFGLFFDYSSQKNIN